MNKMEIDRLTTKLDNLTIKKNNLANGIAKAKSELQEQVKLQPLRRDEVVKGSGLCQGGTVVILNPSRGQSNTGNVCGHTKDRLHIFFGVNHSFCHYFINCCHSYDFFSCCRINWWKE